MTLDPKRRFYLNGYGQKPNEYTWHSQMINRLNTINQSIQNSGGITNANFDAFNRLRVSEPYTLFDSQNRYEKDPQFDDYISYPAGGGVIDYSPLNSSVFLNSGIGGRVVRQTKRRFPYQPGKSLLILATFRFSEGAAGPESITEQSVGYFDDNNGIFFNQLKTCTPMPSVICSSFLSFRLRKNGSDNIIYQSNWNVDKFDGTGPSGRVLDVEKAQILFINLEWLGVGIVKVGFYVDGVPFVAHEFRHDNQVINTYMQTAILPIRYEAIGGNTADAAITQICSSVISEGGYSALSEDFVAKQNTEITNITPAAYLPIVSIKMAAGREGAVILPNKFEFLPLTNQNYEVVLLKNPTLTNSTFANTITNNSNVIYDTAATALTGGEIVDIKYITASGSAGVQSTAPDTVYKWALQLGATYSNVSDIYTLAVKTVSGATQGSGVGFITFYDLTI